MVGAGPAGSMAAKSAAEGGLEVLLVDRELEVGVPDKCGEFLPSLEEMRRLTPKVPNLEEIFDPPNSCIVNRTKYVKFIFPNSIEITIPFKGVVVERKLFDKHLANEAARAGAEVATFTKVVDILKDGTGVKVKNIEGHLDIRSKTIIGADGAYSLISRRAGLPVSKDPLDYGIGYQYEMVNIDHDPDHVEMYLGEDIAPGTYAWIIPKGDDVANVGTGARVPFMKDGLNIRNYFINFLKKPDLASDKLRRAVPTALKAGCIPVGGPMKRTASENLIAVGDAAGHTIPTVGGGVPPGLICGRIAGMIMSEHIMNGNPLTSFDKAWRKQLGTTLENALRIRRMSDIVFKNERMIDLITRRGWLSREMVEKFVLCEMDTKMKLLEKTLMLVK
ncbi:MAG: geranylgeranyl reductase family protein [Candidatus Bathyarchaeia archaeon]